MYYVPTIFKKLFCACVFVHVQEGEAKIEPGF